MVSMEDEPTRIHRNIEIRMRLLKTSDWTLTIRQWILRGSFVQALRGLIKKIESIVRQWQQEWCMKLKYAGIHCINPFVINYPYFIELDLLRNIFCEIFSILCSLWLVSCGFLCKFIFLGWHLKQRKLNRNFVYHLNIITRALIKIFRIFFNIMYILYIYSYHKCINIRSLISKCRIRFLKKKYKTYALKDTEYNTLFY